MKFKVAVLAAVVLLFGPLFQAVAVSETLDFTSLFGGYTGGGYDSLVFNGLTITSRTSVGTGIADPWGPNPPARNGVPGDVYWGNLGNLDVQNQNYYGLGVLTNGQAPSDTTGPITYSEVLIFHFSKPQNGQAVGRQVGFTVLGLNANPSGSSAAPADSMRVWIKVASGEVTSVDINAGAIGIFGPDYGTAISYILQYSNYADESVTDFAIEQTWGSATNPNRRFGIGSVTYAADPVPEPATMLLLGMGLAGAAVLRKRFMK